MKKVFFLGQASARPSSKHDVPGTYLHSWLHSIDYTDADIKEYCYFFALTDTFPGTSKDGHLPPTPTQIAAYRPSLQATLRQTEPDVIVPVGKMAISEIFGQKDVALIDVVGEEFYINPFDSLDHPIICIPFSHPSGRSAWNHLHKELVAKSLQNLQNTQPHLDA
jgi:uracil-DNA glycosylase